MANPVYVTKSLGVASSTGIGTLSTASPGVATINTSNLDTGRRIIIWSTGNLTGASFTVLGKLYGGSSYTEVVAGNNTVAATTQDFTSVTSVSASSVINAAATIGTNNQGGSPWQTINTFVDPPVILGAAMHFTNTVLTASIGITMDDPWNTGHPTVPGGISGICPNSPPIEFISTAFSSATADIWNIVNISGGNNPGYPPIFAWRVTLTASSTGAGSVIVSAIQAGVG